MTVKKSHLIFGIVGLFLSIFLFLLSLLSPARITTIPESTLKNLKDSEKARAILKGAISKKFQFLNNQNLFSSLIDPTQQNRSTQQLGPAALSFYQNLLKWQKSRKPLILFPVSDLRGKPTEILFLIFSILLEKEELSFTLKNHLEKQLITAPKEEWGAFEKSSLALLFLSKRLSLKELGIIFSVVSEPWQLTTLAAFFQLMPNEKENLLFVIDQLPSTYLAEFFNSLAKWKKMSLKSFIKAINISPTAYIYLLKNHLTIGSDWSSFLPKHYPPFSWFNRLQQRYPLYTALFNYILLFCSVFMFLFFLNYLTDAHYRPFFVLYIAFALLTTLVLIFPLEQGNLTAAKLPSLKFSHAISSDLFDPKSIEEGENNMTTQTLPLAFTALFFIIQVFLFFLGKTQIEKIKNTAVGPLVKIELLKNEEHLFDMGLYVGLSGTILSLIFLAMGWVDIGLISAYTSTLFGIIAVALLKLLHVRPFRRSLILKANATE